MHSITKPTKLAEHNAPPLLFTFLDLKAEYALMKEEIRAAVDTITQVAAVHRVPVIEDAAQAIGARYQGSQHRDSQRQSQHQDLQHQYRNVGNIGELGCFSFFPSKNLGGAGDGGMITTNNPSLADRLRVLRVHGARKKYEYEQLGMNSRLDALQAAILRVKLRHLERWTAARRTNAERYRELFKEFRVEVLVQAPGETSSQKHVYNQFTIRASNRDELREHLNQRGIPTELYY